MIDVYIDFHFVLCIYRPSREQHTYPTKREKEHHRLKSALLGDMSVPARVSINIYI